MAKSKKNTRPQFTYGIRGGKIRLARFGDWTFGVRRRLLDAAEDQEAQITIALAGSTLDADSADLLDELTTDEVVKLVVAWQRDAGITMGESETSGES